MTTDRTKLIAQIDKTLKAKLQAKASFANVTVSDLLNQIIADATADITLVVGK
jgi:hypothetical protein